MSVPTSLTEQNRAIVEAVYEATNKGDVEGALSLFSDDVTIDEPLFLPFGKLYRGKAEFIALAPVLQNYLDVASIKLHYIIADGDRVAACVGIPDRETGELTRFIEQFTLKDGKITENLIFYNDAGTLVDKPKVV